MNETKGTNEWQSSGIQVFWGEIAPSDHLLQIYENETVFFNTLEGFVSSGFIKGESVIIIATADHLKELGQRLINQGLDLDHLMESDQYIPVDGEEALQKFLVNNWPDEQLFTGFVTRLIARARKGNRPVRAFGEMVAILWSRGHNGATVRLETLWNKFQEKEKFSLYCAYPKAGFTQDLNDSMQTICCAHNKIIRGEALPSTEIYYKTVTQTVR